MCFLIKKAQKNEYFDCFLPENSVKSDVKTALLGSKTTFFEVKVYQMYHLFHVFCGTVSLN